MSPSPALNREEFEALFWSRATFNVFNGCWEWQRSRSRFGHGLMQGARLFGTTHAHRLAWVLTFGEIPMDVCVLHRCDNAPCVNPSHLYLGDRGDNARDREFRGRGGHLKRVGAANGRAKLTMADVIEIRAQYASTKRREGRTRIGQRFGITYAMVYKIASGQNWKALDGVV